MEVVPAVMILMTINQETVLEAMAAETKNEEVQETEGTDLIKTELKKVLFAMQVVQKVPDQMFIIRQNVLQKEVEAAMLKLL